MDATSKCEDRIKLVWDNKRTGALVTAVFGVTQWEKAHPSVRSMTDRINFCHYHYREAIDMMNGYIAARLEKDGLLSVFNNYDDFSRLMLKIRANFTAFIQSLHAVADICSHMIYFSLSFDRGFKALKERDISFKEVIKILDRQGRAGHREYDKLHSLFCEMTAGDGYKYLNALANTAKHRSIIRSELNEDFTGERRKKWILFLESFWYAGEFFDKADAEEFMQEEHDRILPLIINIGSELNAVLEKLQACKHASMGVENVGLAPDSDADN